MNTTKPNRTTPIRQRKKPEPSTGIHNPALPADLIRSRELVILANGSGEIVGRTGIMVSPIEAESLENSGIEDLFVMSFVPAEFPGPRSAT